ncbi:MAG TPA: alpha-L-fucosidase [Puia sp.]|nr:alpha-L-fucosidase [Puia sp.]
MKYFIGISILSLLLGELRAQHLSIDPSIKTSKVVMSDFMDQQFGMFIHWGPVTLRGTEIGWSRGAIVPAEEYDNLYKEFNPILFDANVWVKTAKDAGMKYLTITAKHHDGFCLWPTAYSDYNIMNSPFKRDIVGELAKACKEQNIRFCIYFTILDWHNPDYPLHNDGVKEPDPKANMRKFILTMKNQLRELVTKYDPYMIWFDGMWESPWTDEMGVDMYTYLKGLKKDLIINDRLGKEISGVDNKQIDVAKMIGDFDTPEQAIGKLNMNFPWESCITICNQWAWKPNDKMKSKKECIQTLVQTAAGNGNLLFNVGPMMDGRIEARQVKRLKEMGDWLKLYGEAIYRTKGGPYKPNKIFATTRKANTIYLQVFSVENNQLSLPGLKDVVINKAYFLKGQPVRFTQDENNIRITLPPKMPDEDCSVIVLELNKNAENISLIE